MIKFTIDNDTVEDLEIGGDTAGLCTDIAVLCSEIYYLLRDEESEEAAECFKEGMNILSKVGLFLKRDSEMSPIGGEVN